MSVVHSSPQLRIIRLSDAPPFATDRFQYARRTAVRRSATALILNSRAVECLFTPRVDDSRTASSTSTDASNQARVLPEIGAGTAIVFSDSAFFRIDTIENAIHVARTLTFELVTGEVPVRMGIARGSYRMLRFLTDSSDHVSFHMSQFLGTGVVRAYQTERCGVPGLRILLHPDLEPLCWTEMRYALFH
jgi:hypothetical protein